MRRGLAQSKTIVVFKDLNLSIRLLLIYSNKETCSVVADAGLLASLGGGTPYGRRSSPRSPPNIPPPFGTPALPQYIVKPHCWNPRGLKYSGGWLNSCRRPIAMGCTAVPRAALVVGSPARVELHSWCGETALRITGCYAPPSN